MTRDQKILAGAALVAAVGGVALVVRMRRPDGTVETIDGIEEVTVTATHIPPHLPLPPTLPASIAASPSRPWSNPSGEQYRTLFNAAEARYKIPAGLLFRQAYQESRFRQDIITGKLRSSAGAVGIMQIIPKFHPSIDPGDAAADERAALDVPKAIDYAGKFLAQLKRQFGGWKLALAAYNAGPGNVRKYDGIPPFKETQNYVAEITRDVKVVA